MDKIVKYLPVFRTIACMMVGLQHTHLSSNSTERQRRVQFALIFPFSGQVVSHRSRRRWVQRLSGTIPLSGTVDWAWSADGRMAVATVVCNRGQHLLTMLSLQGNWGSHLSTTFATVVCLSIHPSLYSRQEVFSCSLYP